MKVYVVLGVLYYEGDTVLQVFKTKELADEYIAMRKAYLDLNLSRGDAGYIKQMGGYQDYTTQELDLLGTNKGGLISDVY